MNFAADDDVDSAFGHSHTDGNGRVEILEDRHFPGLRLVTTWRKLWSNVSETSTAQNLEQLGLRDGEEGQVR